MKTSKSILAINILIIASLLVAFGLIGVLGLTVGQTAATLSIGQPTSTISGLSGTINVPISLRNPGPLSMNDISVSVAVLDQNGDELFHGGGGPISLAPGSRSELPVSISFDLSKLSNSTLEELATTNENLIIRASLSGDVPPLASLNGTISTALPWGAPVEGLSLGTPQITPINSSYVSVSMPVSFTNNNSYVSINGVSTVKVVSDQSGAQVGSGSTEVSAPPGSSFETNMQFPLELPANSENLLFNDTTLSYTAQVSFFESSGTMLFDVSQPVSIDWRAPLSNLTLGAPQFEAYNSTHVMILVPVSFQNTNDYVDISTTLDAGIFNATSGALLGTGKLSVNVPPDSSFSSNFVTYIPLDKLSMNSLLFNDSTLNLKTIVNGTYSGCSFSLTKDFSANWGAPMKNLEFGSLTGSAYNSTTARFTLPFNFTNNSPYLDLSETVGGFVLNGGEEGGQIGTITNTGVYAQRDTFYSGELSGFIELASLSDRTSFTLELTFQTPFGTFVQDVSVSG